MREPISCVAAAGDSPVGADGVLTFMPVARGSLGRRAVACLMARYRHSSPESFCHDQLVANHATS